MTPNTSQHLRLAIIAAGLCLPALHSSTAAEPATERSAQMSRVLEPLLTNHRGQVAVAIEELSGETRFAYRADQAMPTASLIKLPVMIEAYRQAAAGRISLDDRLTLSEDDKVPGSGILTKHFTAGAVLSLRDAIRLMIAYSDNTATNLVLDHIGLAATRSTMQQMGLTKTAVYAKVFRRDTSIDPDASRQFGLGSTTAAEMVSLLRQLHQGSLVNPQACREMLEHLEHCEDRSKLPRDLPSSVKFAHKTGSVNRVRTDAGILTTDSGPVAVCVLTADNEDTRWTDENEAAVLCGRIGRVVFDLFRNRQDPQTEVRQTLTLGAAGDLVEDLQRTLNNRLEASQQISVDGDFGPQTKQAIEDFQRQQKLTVTGIVDAPTWDKLGPLVTRGPPVPSPEETNSKQLPLQPVDPLTGPPVVTCRAWAIADLETGQLIDSHLADQRLDIASTTKMMTALVVLELLEQSPERWQERIRFSAAADQTRGSTAGIRTGESVTCEELLYGLLLPSGNDASVAFAEHFGEALPGPSDLPAAERFVARMNTTAKRLGMNSTHFANPHGLTADNHLSTAEDLLVLARTVMKYDRFRTVVGSRQYGCRALGASGYQRNILWENTNQLLEIEGYIGVKTGTTTAAGACLVSASERNGERQLVVVLGSRSSPARYVDSRNLHRWGWRSRLDPAKSKVSAAP